MNLITIILIAYLVGLVISYRRVKRLAMMKFIEDYHRGRMKQETAYAVYALAVVGSALIWPLVLGGDLIDQWQARRATGAALVPVETTRGPGGGKRRRKRR